MFFNTRKKQEQNEKTIIEKYFDPEFYLKSNPDVANSSIDPLNHFMKFGYKEGRDPNSWFSVNVYLATNPDVKSSNINPFYHYLINRSDENKTQDKNLISKYSEINDRLNNGSLSELINKAAKLEPLIRFPTNIKRDIKFRPNHDDAIQLMNSMKELHKASSNQQAKYIVLIPHCRMSGATRIGGELTAALTKIAGTDQVILIRTDSSEFEYPEWFPNEIRNVDFSKITNSIHRNKLTNLLFNYIRSLNPDTVFNVNSLLFYKTFSDYGIPLTKSINIFMYLFCADINKEGFEVGYPIQYFYDGILSGAKFVTDNEMLLKSLIERYKINESEDVGMIEALPTPVRELPAVYNKTASKIIKNNKPVIVWAGRFDRQKRIDLVKKIARSMNDCDFYIFGKGVLDNNIDLNFTPNVHLYPPFRNIRELPLDKCDLWLYTSQWDGVPTILLDVVAAGIPLVTSNSGAVTELVNKELTYIVDDIDNTDEYINGIRYILDNYTRARENAQKLRQLTFQHRSVQNYVNRVNALINKS